MKVVLILILMPFWIGAQQQVNVIEGYTEIFPSSDTASMYIGKQVGRFVSDELKFQTVVGQTIS